MVLDQPLDAVVRAAAFFVGGERHDDVAVRPVSFPLVANQVGDPDGRLGFVVGGATAVEISILFDESKRIHAPVFPLGLDHIGVGQKQNRFEPARAVVPHYQVRLRGNGAADEDVGIREPRGA